MRGELAGTSFPSILKANANRFYIPYIAQRILDASEDEEKATPIDLQSILINDGVYSS